MSEHYTRLTVEASAWCPRCHRHTQHRVDPPKLGPCLVCMAKQDAEIAAIRHKQDEEQKRQPGLFDDPIF